MSTDDRVVALKTKHAELDAAIVEENARPHPDDVEIAQLKKQKLAIKDEIANIGTSIGTG